MEHQFLYRALRLLEIEENYSLIPKSIEKFTSEPAFGIDMTFPIVFGGEVNAIRQHQHNRAGRPTRGISTTPHYQQAITYAGEHNIIVKIGTSKFEQLGIRTYDVNKELRQNEIAVPEDNEIILVYDKDGAFPSEIIVEIIKI